MWSLSESIVGVLVALIIVLITVKVRKRFRYFSDRGLQHITPTWKDTFFSSSMTSFNDFPEVIYERCRGKDYPYVGFFHAFHRPSILLRDPKVIESILIKDFSHFQDHGLYIDFESNPLAGHLFNMKGDEWRTLRHKLVPTFTSGKLKGMVPIMEECADKLIEEIRQDSSFRQDTNLKELFKRYSLSVIASCAFGIDPEGIKDPNCEFRRILHDIVTPSWFTGMRFTMLFLLPSLSKKLNLKMFPKHIEDFLIRITRESLELRKKSGVKRNDFIQLLLELREKGSVELDVKDLEQDEKVDIPDLQSQLPPGKLKFTDELLAAQVFVFLIGGFENTAYLSAITMYLLSKHPQIKSRVAQEVKRVRDEYGGLDYQALRDMKLLGACLDEALRLYPPAQIILRESNKPYTFSDGKKIEKGVAVILPAKSLHLDSQYWTDPLRFNPDRFLTPNNIKPGTYLPFGDGPRICIAQRLALLTVKLILAKMILNFDPLPSPKTKEPLNIKVVFVADNEGGIWGSFKDLKN